MQLKYNTSVNFRNQYSISKFNKINHIDVAAENTKLGARLIRRAEVLPEIMSKMVYDTGMYLEKSIDKDEYIKRYCESTDPLYRRIVCGKNKEEFNESYKTEIKFLTSIRDSINGIMSKNEDIADFDAKLNSLTTEYLKTPIQRSKYFVI